MGKSPAKWIKSLLSGKKSSKSSTSKNRDVSKIIGEKGAPLLSATSPVISEPVLVSSNHPGIVPGLEKETIGANGTSTVAISLDGGIQTGSAATQNASNLLEEQAATKAQAAFRGYLARRAFRALKGIIRLQALIRGHLVRRQAVATLHSMEGIIKLQALVRGRRVRRASDGVAISIQLSQAQVVVDKPLDALKVKYSTTVFVYKLLSRGISSKFLQIQYEEEDSNSVHSWLGRWTANCCSKPLVQPKKLTESKVQTKKSNYAMETESGKSKRTVRRNSAANADSGQSNAPTEPEKLRRTLRKMSNSSAEPLQENPQSELEKVKRNLRKITNSMSEPSDCPEIETEKLNQNLRKTVPDVQEKGIEISEQEENNIASSSEMKLDVETPVKLMVAEEPNNMTPEIQSSSEVLPLQQIDHEDNTLATNGDLYAKEDQLSHDGQKAKRRSSFSAKSEYAENGIPTTPVLPSYMQATESAKAKLRAQGSPRMVTDSVEKDSLTRRHSLPSSVNGKLNSSSPRTQKPNQGSGGKGGTRTDKSLQASRDANAEKPIRVEWRR